MTKRATQQKSGFRLCPSALILSGQVEQRACTQSVLLRSAKIGQGGLGPPGFGPGNWGFGPELRIENSEEMSKNCPRKTETMARQAERSSDRVKNQVTYHDDADSNSRLRRLKVFSLTR